MPAPIARLSLLTILGVILLPSCAPAAARPEERFSASSFCIARGERPCEREERECRVERDQALDQCWIDCVSIGDCSTCSRVAREPDGCHQCRGESTAAPCTDYRFSFHRARTEDPAVAEACRRYFTTYSACGAEVEGDPCAAFARVERPEASAAYDCLTAAGCDAAASDACERPPPVHGLEHAVCSVLHLRCGTTCTAELSAWLRHTDGWLRTDVALALQVCVDTPACHDYVECVNAWLDEVQRED
jgi:hypothetical protein